MLLLEGCSLLATFDDQNRELHDVDILIRGGLVAEIGSGLRNRLSLPADVAYLDCRNALVMPGFVNVHHHLFQSLTRVAPEAQNVGLFDWLRTNYQVWQHHTRETLRAAARLSFAELLLSGVTTTTDHHYLFPTAQSADWWDETIFAARDLGIRFHATRGSMTLGVDEGGLPPMSLVESTDRVLADYARVIETYHSSDPTAMTRIALAPCAPFNVSEDLFRETARLAEQYDVLLHTHLAETDDETAYCLERFGCRPLDYIARLGWESHRVWLAHCVTLNTEEIRRFADQGIGVAHCPSANARLGSGVAPIKAMLEAGVRVGIGVDGSSSNDSGSFGKEVRLAFLLQRSAHGPDAVTARQMLRVATRGGASILHNSRIGRLEVGSCADVQVIHLDRLEFAGGGSRDPLATVVFSGLDAPVDYSLVNGRFTVFEQRLANLSTTKVVNEANAATKTLYSHSTTPAR
ncbi:MAG: 8-oxoguanine deaminase [Candidatus Sumerlaeia bacterium]|nr:8-oxoguanine deaminase [Candidatus Sumerlaeia bacterium]